MKRPLRLSADFALPLELVTESVAIIARKRAGKSYTARKLAEQLHQAGQQLVIVDPKGDWWGIRSSADGKAAGLPIVILGGEHGDVPLEEGAGELVARMVVVDRVSVLLDLSELRKHQVTKFMTAFLETIYRLKAKEVHRTPVMVLIDEADAIAPQRPMPDEARMLGAAEDIVRRGGQRGIGVTLITQRAAVLNKNVLTQTSILVALVTTGSQDLDALDDWIKKHGQQEKRAELMAAIANLPRGTGWWWAPGWPDDRGIFREVRVDPIETFDSGATPKPGEKRVAPKTVADVDLDAFRREMAATIEKAKAEDPKALLQRIRTLEAELRKKPTAAQTTKEKRVEVPVLRESEIKRVEVVAARLERVSNGASGLALALREAIRARLRDHPAPPTPVSSRTETIRQQQRGGAGRVTAVMVSRGSKPELPQGEHRVLTAIAQHGDDGVTREQLTILTGYKRSTRDAYVQRLRERQLVELAGERVIATVAGWEALGPSFEPLPTGDELRTYWLARLPEGERRVLEIVIGVHPKTVERDVISDATGYQRSTRDAYLQRLGARRLIIAEGRGQVRASEVLFG